MTKALSFRFSEETAALLKERAAAAGVSQVDYLTSLIVNGGVTSQRDSSPVESGDSEKVQTMMAAAVKLEAEKAALHDEVLELKRRLRASRDVSEPKDEPWVRKNTKAPSISGGKKCPHGLMLTIFCRHCAAEGKNLHTYHSGVSPVPGCDKCTALAKSA